ncbi:MAG: cation:proton antiporter [Saprospiraceae bacterium]|nr:cation:proton antiporter [Saprospiraceae bacterium]
MTTAIIISICSLLLLAYVFDISSNKTRIPTVILLLLLGFVVKQICLFLHLELPPLDDVLPVLGTIGLILIVLEGALELELNSSKKKTILQSSIIALIPMLIISFAFGFAFSHFGDVNLKTGLINAIPFAIISSAIAIPSAANLILKDKEFITYESSLSDIFGVIIFNFLLYHHDFGMISIWHFTIELLLILLISFLSTMALAYLLQRINHHIKFTPILLLVILIYAISKVYHLPSLLFILIFGLFLGNIDELRQYKFMEHFHPINFNKEIIKFKELLGEIAFSIRSLFFLLFGYLMDIAEILNSQTIPWALAITASIFLIRAIFLKIFSISLRPLLYIAPRGLITILLFISIPIESSIGIVNKSLILQVIILSALLMMFGLMNSKKSPI